jgi:hypothetical protein
MPEETKGRIFISYASERANLAEDIAAALTVEGYDVFFDRSSLTPGEPYGDHIRGEIARSDVFVILVSAEILKDESYVLTELKLAKQMLAQRKAHILPVVILPVDYGKLDPYLTRLTALYPEGNTAAEVAAQVSEMLDGRSQAVHEARPDVAGKQLEAYQLLWMITGELPKWGGQGSRTYGDLAKLSQSLRKWYFKHAGGLFFSRASYSRYAELQNALESLDAPEAGAEVSAVDYESIRRLCSALRHEMANDLGTRR